MHLTNNAACDRVADLFSVVDSVNTSVLRASTERLPDTFAGPDWAGKDRWHSVGVCTERAEHRAASSKSSRFFWIDLVTPDLPRTRWPAQDSPSFAIIHGMIWCALFLTVTDGTVLSLTTAATHLCDLAALPPHSPELSPSGRAWFKHACWHGVGHGLFWDGQRRRISAGLSPSLRDECPLGQSERHGSLLDVVVADPQIADVVCAAAPDPESAFFCATGMYHTFFDIGRGTQDVCISSLNPLPCYVMAAVHAEPALNCTGRPPICLLGASVTGDSHSPHTPTACEEVSDLSGLCVRTRLFIPFLFEYLLFDPSSEGQLEDACAAETASVEATSHTHALNEVLHFCAAPHLAWFTSLPVSKTIDWQPLAFLVSSMLLLLLLWLLWHRLSLNPHLRTHRWYRCWRNLAGSRLASHLDQPDACTVWHRRKGISAPQLEPALECESTPVSFGSDCAGRANL